MPIYQKIQQVMQAVHGVEKDSFNKHAGYKYAGHEAVTAALRDHFAKVGIVRQVSASECELLSGGTVKLTVDVSYIDTEDESRIDLEIPAIQPSQTKAGTVTAQQVGQAVSYAVKNIEFKLFALTGDSDPDADSAPLEREPVDWTHPKQRNGKAQTEQATSHQQAATAVDVVVKCEDDSEQTAQNAVEAAKMLAGRIKATSYFHAARLMELNIDWIAKLPRSWQDRLESLCTSKRTEASAEGSALGHGTRGTR